MIWLRASSWRVRGTHDWSFQEKKAPGPRDPDGPTTRILSRRSVSPPARPALREPLRFPGRAPLRNACSPDRDASPVDGGCGVAGGNGGRAVPVPGTGTAAGFGWGRGARDAAAAPAPRPAPAAEAPPPETHMRRRWYRPRLLFFSVSRWTGMGARAVGRRHCVVFG
jgi:hypothetical protein